jgi:hypothetical protein
MRAEAGRQQVESQILALEPIDADEPGPAIRFLATAARPDAATRKPFREELGELKCVRPLFS